MTDEIGCPTYAPDLVEAMARLDIALRDAAVDAYSGKIKYAEKPFGRAKAA